MTEQSPTVASAHDVGPKALEDFYTEMFPGRATARIWRWLNRSSYFDERTPLVLVEGDRVLAHAGMIPFGATLGDDSVTAAWFIDFAVRPDLQRRGLGSALEATWARFPDVGLGFPNALSIGTARKVGWSENDDTQLLFYPLRPFDHPRVGTRFPRPLRRVLNGFARRHFARRYRRLGTNGSPDVRPLTEADVVFLAERSRRPAPGTFVPNRDVETLRWRLLESPDRASYRFVRSGEAGAVLKLRRKGDARAADLLLVEGGEDVADEIRVVADACLWAAGEGCAYVRQLHSEPGRAQALVGALGARTKPRTLVFGAKDPDLAKRLAAAVWRWQLLDSDFERFGNDPSA